MTKIIWKLRRARRWWLIRAKRLRRLLVWNIIREIRYDLLYGHRWTPDRSSGGQVYYRCDACGRVSLKPTSGISGRCPEKTSRLSHG